MSRLSATPSGQPKAYPRTKLDVSDSAEEKRLLPKFIYPHDVINIRSEKQLQKELQEQKHPFPMLPGSPMPKNKHAMRYHMEWVRPTLRWYCKVYGVDVPEWLKGNGSMDGVSSRTQTKLVGPEPLKVVEWHENKRAGRAS